MNTVNITTKLAQRQGLTELLSWSIWGKEIVGKTNSSRGFPISSIYGGRRRKRDPMRSMATFDRVEVPGLLQKMKNKTKPNPRVLLLLSTDRLKQWLTYTTCRSLTLLVDRRVWIGLVTLFPSLLGFQTAFSSSPTSQTWPRAWVLSMGNSH